MIMWNILIFCAFLMNVQTADIEKIYGDWAPVMLFPNTVYVPVCVRYAFSEDERNLQCSCTDGRSSTLVKMIMTEGPTPENVLEPPMTYPALAVDDHKEVQPLLNVSCTCGGQSYPTRYVFKYIDGNYFVMYMLQEAMKIVYTAENPNTANLMAKSLRKMDQLLTDVQKIPELSNRPGGVVCTTEAYREFNTISSE